MGRGSLAIELERVWCENLKLKEQLENFTIANKWNIAEITRLTTDINELHEQIYKLRSRN